ncbi:ribonuclease H-like domain-containing protein [Halovivax limisalsi]|uniref:ribonuclease H-like domain-containing protein n=1 Tax=Halovivax limisalsi TaxID=1453760 RepID=UPI001FFC577D|nr:ribonuclease H-like domain-containing protein [Halovivax limisalsi]
MDAAAGLRLLALPAEMAATREPAALTDARTYADPDLVLLPGPDRRPRAAARARRHFDVPVVHPPLGGANGAVSEYDIGSTRLVSVQRATALSSAGVTLDGTGSDGTDESAILVCDDVGISVDRTTLDASLDHADALVDPVPADRRHLTVLTGRLPATYDRCWLLDRESGAVRAVREPAEVRAGGRSSSDASAVRVRVRGVGSVDNYGDSATVVQMDLAPDTSSGRDGVGDRGESDEPWPIRTVEPIGADAFGVRAVDGVGPKTAAALAERGVRSKADLLETPVSDLTSLPGIGETAAHRMHQHARVLETGEPRRVTVEPLPGETDAEPPLCLDIETDGLSPTIVWQIGVYDPATDDYRAFVERSDPSDPGRVVESFLEWVLGTQSDRTLLTWNGWRFDYTHLESFVERFVPSYRETWESIAKRDLYRWAVTDGNAVLPGRTNKLAAVADAVGYESEGTGLDGATTAAAYSRFIRTGEPLDWERHERYCEDDCRALWAIYEALDGAPVFRRGSEPSPAGQTGLGDFS